MDPFRQALTERVRRDMAIVVDECRKRIDTLVSVILFGGFARDEGSALRVNGEVLPIGDYDLLAVTRDAVSPQTIDAVVENVSDRTYREAVGFESPGIAPRVGASLRF